MTASLLYLLLHGCMHLRQGLVKHANVCPVQAGAEDLPGAPLVNERAPQRFMPFSLGPRDCVGQTLARLNLATTLAQLYGSFTFRLAAEVCAPSLQPCTRYLPTYPCPMSRVSPVHALGHHMLQHSHA
jgi:hypothetical protein